jgi:hypothetical protein
MFRRISHPFLLQGMNLSILEQTPATKGARERCPYISRRNRLVQGHEERTIIKHQVLDRAAGNYFVETLTTTWAREDCASEEHLV